MIRRPPRPTLTDTLFPSPTLFRSRHCSDDVLAAIGELRADGALVAIDDFGTGYSNLARLKVLPIDRLKLDRSNVEHIVQHTVARAVAQAALGLNHGLGCQAVAEAETGRAHV